MLLNDLLSAATFCTKAVTPAFEPANRTQLCWAVRGHLTGGMVGIKATLDALQKLGRGTELLEALTLTDFPSLGNFVSAGATALWSDWDDREDAAGTYYCE